MRRSTRLPEWEAVVQQLTALGGQNGAPDVQWSSGTNASYVARTDVLAVGRHFARRWEPSSRQAVWLLAHELGHRSVGSRNPEVQARRIALRSAPAIAAAIIGSLLTAAAFVAEVGTVRPGTLYLARASASGIIGALAVVSLTIIIIAHITARVAQTELFAAEFAADDYATSLVGAEGVNVLAVMPERRRRDFIVPRTHPPTRDRVRRQQAAICDKEQTAEQ
jgi:hypothetical protein